MSDFEGQSVICGAGTACNMTPAAVRGRVKKLRNLWDLSTAGAHLIAGPRSRMLLCSNCLDGARHFDIAAVS